MTNKTEVTREEAITAAAMLFEQDQPLALVWYMAGGDADYTRGVLDLLVDLFAVEGKSGEAIYKTIWAEIRAKHEEIRKPWLNAKPGEVWLINLGEGLLRGAVVNNYGQFAYTSYHFTTLAINSPAIVNAKRIHPKED